MSRPRVDGARPWQMGALAWGLLALAAAVGVATAPAAEARSDVASSAELEVLALTGALEPGDGLSIRVRVRNDGGAALENARIVATLHRRTTSRFEYQQALDDGEVTELVHPFTTTLDEIAPGRSEMRTLTQTAAELGFSQPDGLYGVYPLRLRLQDGEDVLDEVVTSVVLTPSEVDEPVRAALLLPLDSGPTLQPDGAHAADDLVASAAPGGRLRGLVTAPEARRDVPLTIAVSGLLTDQLQDLAGGFAWSRAEGQDLVEADEPPSRDARDLLDDLGSLAGRAEIDVLPLGYGPPDLPAFARAELEGEARLQLRGGADALERRLGTEPTRETWWPADGLDNGGLAAAVHAGVETVVLPEGTLALSADRDLRFSPPPVRRVRAPGHAATALVPDPWLQRSLTDEDGTDGGVIAAQRILGETAAIFFERPFLDRPRGVVVAPPLRWDPPAGMLGALLAGLDEMPWVDAVTADTLGSVVPNDSGSVALDYPSTARQRELPPTYLAAIADAREDLAGFGGVLGDDALAADLQRRLHSAGSIHYRDDLAAGRALVDSVRETVSEVFDALVVVDSPPVVLSSLEGQIPVAIRNNGAVPVDVRVRLETPRYEFADGPVAGPWTLGPGETRTVAFTARALTPGGVHQLRVVIEDAEGRQALAEGTMAVRSTAVSTTALVITGAAALFLAAWWIRDWQRRRRRRHDLEPERVAAATR